MPKKPPIPSATRVVPVPAREPVSEWTEAAARSALLAHEKGDFSQSARLADSLGRDGRVAGDLGTRTKALGARAGLPFTVEKSDEGDQRRAETIADRIKRRWWRTIPDATLTTTLKDAVLLGASIGYLSWTPVTSPYFEWVPRLHWLPPHNLRFDEWVDGWSYMTTTGFEKVTPGDGRWFLHEPNGPRTWMGGAIRALGLPHVAVGHANTDWNRFNEKHGLPILQVEEPYHANDEVEQGGGTTHADQFYAQFSQLGGEGVLRLPQGDRDGETGWKAKWMELVATVWKTFPERLKDLGSLSRLILLGQDDTSASPMGGDGEGSRSRVKIEYLASDCEPLATTIRDQIWMPWGRYNIPNWSDELAAWGRWNTEPPVDRKARALMLESLAKALPLLATEGADVRAILKEFQIPLVPKGQERKPAPEVGREPEPTEDESNAIPS